MRVETAWLIERTRLGAPEFWEGRQAGAFTSDANDAIRFSRRKDAERALGWLMEPQRAEIRITEHAWIPETPA